MENEDEDFLCVPEIKPLKEITPSMIGERVKMLRESLNMKQADLGDVLHIKANAISQIERGVNQLSAKQIITLARCFKVKSDFILCLDDEGLGNVDVSNFMHEVEEARKLNIATFRMNNEGLELLEKIAQVIADKYEIDWSKEEGMDDPDKL